MANIFISYGDDNFKESLIRIKKHAKSVGIFDKIITYTPKDLPPHIKSSPLFAFKRGGGYWVWKPYIIYQTLLSCEINDVVYYVDAGCTLNANSNEWQTFQKLIDEYNAIFFQYRDSFNYPGWELACSDPDNNSVKIKHWIKPSTTSYFIQYCGNKEFLESNKIWGGFCIIKKTPRLIKTLEEWYKITLFHPELIIDPFGPELSQIPKTFNLHKHDQTILTALIFYYKKSDNILVLDETSESQKDKAAVSADRYRVGKMSFILYLKYRIYKFIHPI